MPVKILNKWLAITVSLLLCLLTGSCALREETQQIDLSERVSDTSRLKRKIESDNSLTFCFDNRLTPREDTEIYASLLDYLEGETELHFTLLFSRDYQGTIDNIGSGRADFAIIGGLSYLRAEHDYQVKMLVKGLDSNKQGYYQGAIITGRTDLSLNIPELKDKCFAFGSWYSTQGHLIPRYMLEQEGIFLKDLKEYLFTGSHWECAQAVINGEAAAGGIQDTLAFQLEQDGYVTIIALSDYFPRSGIAVNRNVPSAIKEKVKAALLDLDPPGTHKQVLKNWSKTEMPGGFIGVDAQDYAGLRTLAVKYQLLGE